ncbi:MAG TPA: hypothetical protein VG496_11850 [Myxococcales bacterium]|nr:hypothetical protein [Myxococcales bacterium]
MRTRALFGSLLALSLLALPARAQVQMQITVGLPVVLPPMVVVQPGVQVVSELDEEVYFVGGWYWVRRGPHWYRTHDHHGRWMWVEPRAVPAALVGIPPGRYRHIRHEEWKRMERERRERDKAERRGWKEREKERHREWKERENAEHAAFERDHHGHDRD